MALQRRPSRRCGVPLRYQESMSDIISPSSDCKTCQVCRNKVNGRQHAISCDQCGGWTHRLCDVQITYQQYCLLRRDQISVNFNCRVCCETEGLEYKGKISTSHGPSVQSRHTPQSSYTYVPSTMAGKTGSAAPPPAAVAQEAASKDAAAARKVAVKEAAPKEAAAKKAAAKEAAAKEAAFKEGEGSGVW